MFYAIQHKSGVLMHLDIDMHGDRVSMTTEIGDSIFLTIDKSEAEGIIKKGLYYMKGLYAPSDLCVVELQIK